MKSSRVLVSTLSRLPGRFLPLFYWKLPICGSFPSRSSLNFGQIRRTAAERNQFSGRLARWRYEQATGSRRHSSDLATWRQSIKPLTRPMTLHRGASVPRSRPHTGPGLGFGWGLFFLPFAASDGLCQCEVHSEFCELSLHDSHKAYCATLRPRPALPVPHRAKCQIPHRAKCQIPHRAKCQKHSDEMVYMLSTTVNEALEFLFTHWV